MGYLRYHYPVEFITSFLNCAKNDEDINNGALLAVKKKNIKIEPPYLDIQQVNMVVILKTK